MASQHSALFCVPNRRVTLEVVGQVMKRVQLLRCSCHLLLRFMTSIARTPRAGRPVNMAPQVARACRQPATDHAIPWRCLPLPYQGLCAPAMRISPTCFEQKPCTRFRVVDVVLEHTGRRHVAVFVGNLVRATHYICEGFVIFHQLP